MQIKKETSISFFASFSFHILLLVVFSFVVIEMKKEAPTFITLEFKTVEEPIKKLGSKGAVNLPLSSFYKEEIPLPVYEKMAIESKLEPKPIDVGEKETGEIETIGERSTFTLSGEISKRSIVWKVLPQYPEGLQKEVILKFRFSVSPEGSVGEIIPLMKGDPTLERLTISSLSQWRFSLLPKEAPQLYQEGIITFIYRLE